MSNTNQRQSTVQMNDYLSKEADRILDSWNGIQLKADRGVVKLMVLEALATSVVLPPEPDYKLILKGKLEVELQQLRNRLKDMNILVDTASESDYRDAELRLLQHLAMMQYQMALEQRIELLEPTNK